MNTTQLLALILGSLDRLNNDREVHQNAVERRRHRDAAATACEELAKMIRSGRTFDQFPKVIKGHLVNGGMGFRVVE